MLHIRLILEDSEVSYPLKLDSHDNWYICTTIFHWGLYRLSTLDITFYLLGAGFNSLKPHLLFIMFHLQTPRMNDFDISEYLIDFFQ